MKPSRIRTETNLPRPAEWMKDFFKDKDVFILGSGPSLTDFDFKRLTGKTILAVNHMWQYVAPTMLVFLDSIFRAEEMARGVDFTSLPFPVVTGPSSGLTQGKNCFRFHYAGKPEMSGLRFYGMSNSALFALNVALYCNAAKIYLMGIDCCFQNGASHFYSAYKKHARDGKPEPYELTARHFEQFATFKNVFNLSPISTIKCFPKIDMAEIL